MHLNLLTLLHQLQVLLLHLHHPLRHPGQQEAESSLADNSSLSIPLSFSERGMLNLNVWQVVFLWVVVCCLGCVVRHVWVVCYTTLCCPMGSSSAVCM